MLPDPNRNNPPVLLGSQVDVPNGDSASIDLARLTTDPDDGDVQNMKYELVGDVPAGFNAGIDGTDPEGSRPRTARPPAPTAPSRSRPGTRAVWKPPRPTSCTVTASNRPKPVANDDVEPNAAAGKPVTVPVLANDANPFPETPLKIVAATTETGQRQRRRRRRQRDGDPGRGLLRAPWWWPTPSPTRPATRPGRPPPGSG